MCGKELFSRSNIFCNSSCSAKFNNVNRKPFERTYITPEWKLKQSINTKENWLRGKFSMPKEIFSSKNEREIVLHFKQTFPNDGWKSGGRLILDNKETLSRDMWSDKLKVCFEYDGIWHFKDIHGQLNRKQLKDKMLEQWCINNGYRLVRIDEDFYRNVQQIEDLIYNNCDSITKIGNRY